MIKNEDKFLLKQHWYVRFFMVIFIYITMITFTYFLLCYAKYHNQMYGLISLANLLLGVSIAKYRLKAPVYICVEDKAISVLYRLKTRDYLIDHINDVQYITNETGLHKIQIKFYDNRIVTLSRVYVNFDRLAEYLKENIDIGDVSIDRQNKEEQ